MKSIQYLALSIFLIISTSAYAAPKSDLWDKWKKYDRKSEAVIDFSKFDNFLQEYVVTGSSDKINKVKYDKVSDKDRQSLKTFLDEMQAVKVSTLNKNMQMVYWINLYNATTINVILDNMPIKSIRDIGLFGKGPWDKDLLVIEGEDVTLNDIEHRILRPIWRDNRLHYVLNCASLGCPNIQDKAFKADTIEKDLSSAAAEFIVPNRAFRIIQNSFPGKPRESLHLSSLYKWYKSDFGFRNEHVIKSISGYMDDEYYNKIKDFDEVDSHFYDWGLNIQ